MQNSGKYSEKSCILDNTNRVGGHVCTWRHEVDGHRARTKVYNKVVSQWFSQGAWEKAIQWMPADFGFRRCPIFVCQTLEVQNDEVVLSKLSCYKKDTPTILAASKRPSQLHLGAPDPKMLLPPTKHVEWACRKKKMHAIDVEKPSCELVEIPQIAAQRELSTPSTRNRERCSVALCNNRPSHFVINWKWMIGGQVNPIISIIINTNNNNNNNNVLT